MSNTLALTKILMKGMFSFGERKKKNKILLVILVLALVVCCIPFATQTRELATFLGTSGTNLMLEMLVILNSILLLVISFTSNIGVVYFSKDNDVLLHMPLKPKEIFFARNIIVIISCYFICLLFFLPSMVGVGIGMSVSWHYYVFGVLATLLLPIIPCFISGIITLLVVKYLKFIKSKDLMTYLTLGVSLVIAIGFEVCMNYLMPVVDETVDAFALIENYKLFINNLSWFLPYAIPLMKIVNFSTNVVYKFIYLFGIAGIGTFIVYFAGFLADKMYFTALLKINGNGTKKKKFNELKFKKKTSNNSLNKVLIQKELKTLLRTPIFLVNLLVPMVFPLALLLVVIPIVKEIGYSDLITITYYGKNYLIWAVLAIAMICSLSNFSSCVMYSKDGSGNKTMNYLPISFMKNYLVKVLVVSFISLVPYAILIVVIQNYLRFELLDILYPICLGLLFIVSVNFLGLFIDINRPKIKWNSETEAVKSNLNVFIYMLLLIIYGVVCFFIKEYSLVLFIVTIGLIVGLIYRNENKYIDKLS